MHTVLSLQNQAHFVQLNLYIICAMLNLKELPMLDRTTTDLSHGKVFAHYVKANLTSKKGTGSHRHEANFQIVIN